jgi:hypothetical protein
MQQTKESIETISDLTVGFTISGVELRSSAHAAGFSRTGTLACPRVPWRCRTRQTGVSVLPSTLTHYPPASEVASQA